jgi:hypothetical protein
MLMIASLVLSFSAQASKFNTEKRYLYVQPGQSIFNIVQVLYADQQKYWPEIIRKIVRTNPHAFVGADATKILPGERIELPAYTSSIRPSSPPTSSKAVVYKGPSAVGQVIKSRGRAFVLSNEHERRDLVLGSEVFVGDRIFTGVEGFIRLSMIDDAKIDLRCNSEMRIEDYQLLRGANRSVLRLIKGSVKKITGSIGKVAEDIYEMHTPIATVGVRGTEYAIRVLQSHGCDGSLDVNSDGLFVKVSRGAIDVKSDQQEVALNSGQAAHLADDASQIKAIEARDGVFDEVTEEKKTFLGSISWLLFMPALLLIGRVIGHVRS